MSNRRPSHIFPDTNEGMIWVVLLYSAIGAGVYNVAVALLFTGTILGVATAWAITALALIASAVAVGCFRRHRYVIPFDREAAHHCPRCDYDIGEDHMEHGCAECGWQRQGPTSP